LAIILLDKLINYLLASIFSLYIAGLIGMIFSNDIFNIYVFMEISSIAAYVLVLDDENKKSNNAAFNYLVAGTTGDYVFNTQPAGLTASSGLLAPVSSVTYNIIGETGSECNNLSGLTGFAIIGWNSDMSGQGSTGTLYMNGVQAGLAGDLVYLNDGSQPFGNTGSTIFDLTGTPWVPGSNILVFEPSNPLSLVPDVFLTMDSANFQMPASVE
jgi:hypothetical protein